MMKSRIFVNLFSVVFFTFVLFTALPLMAQEFAMGTQLALRGVNAEDADAAIDDNSPKNSKPESIDLKKDNSPQTLEQEVRELRQEVQKIRSENEARKKLEVPEEEKGKTIEDILSAAGRQYSLLKKGTIGLSYTFNYSYYSGDAINEASVVERRYNHNVANIITTEYALRNNLTVSANFPFDYKYNRVGTASSQEATDLGDISLGLTLQPFLWKGSMPTTIFSVGVSLPTGSNPYKINTSHSLATGSGYYSVNAGVSLSKVIDPLVAFGNLSYSYGLPAEGLSQYWSKTQTLTKMEPGSSIGVSFGFGYALSYQASLNMGAQISYSFDNKYTINDTQTFENGTNLSAAFNVGTGWRISPARSIYVSLGLGLTVNDPDISLSLKLPFEF
jgi:hypothetical protein